MTLKDTGERDENGFELMDHLFSSPEKPATSRKINGRDANASLSSDDMDIGESKSFSQRNASQILKVGT